MIAHHVGLFLSRCDGRIGTWPGTPFQRALALARQPRARRFEAGVLAFRAELERLAGRRSEALVDVTDALRITC